MKDAKGFFEYLSYARDKFCKHIMGREWDNALRTECDSFLIAYDQLREQLRVATTWSNARESKSLHGDMIVVLMKSGLMHRGFYSKTADSVVCIDCEVVWNDVDMWIECPNLPEKK